MYLHIACLLPASQGPSLLSSCLPHFLLRTWWWCSLHPLAAGPVWAVRRLPYTPSTGGRHRAIYPPPRLAHGDAQLYPRNNAAALFACWRTRHLPPTMRTPPGLLTFQQHVRRLTFWLARWETGPDLPALGNTPHPQPAPPQDCKL